MLAAPAAIDVICHGSGNGGGADSTAPGTAKVEHLCCVFCTSAAPALPPPAAPRLAEVRQIPRPAIVSSFTFVISPGAIRAGPSQAPPILACACASRAGEPLARRSCASRFGDP